MKLFEQPEVNVIKFAVEDVITVSGNEATNDPADDMEWLDPMSCIS